MDALECIATRRSIRRFADQPVDQETMLSIVEAGTYAPSSGNVQDWKFVLVDDKALLRKLSEHSLGQECVHNAAFLVLVCADHEQTERNYGLRGERLYTIQNCAAAIENMLLAAHAMGIGAVWVGAFDEEKIKTLLNIPHSVRPQALLAFGYPAEKPEHKIMKDLGLVVYFNAYGTRIKNIHRFFRDYSVEWEKRINEAKHSFGKLREKTKEFTSETKEKLTKEDGVLKRYKTKITESFKKMSPPKRNQ